MTKPIKFEVLPDEHIAEDETVNGDALFNDIMAGFAELEDFAEGHTAQFSGAQAAAGEQGKTLRVSEYVDGEHIPATMLTQKELTARQAAHEASSACPAPTAVLPLSVGYAVACRADDDAEPVAGQVTAKTAATSHSV